MAYNSLADATTAPNFKCSNCGSMYPTDDLEEKPCPVCGHVNRTGKSVVLQASNEDF